MNDKCRGTITHLCTWPSKWQPPHIVNTGSKRDPISPLNSLVSTRNCVSVPTVLRYGWINSTQISRKQRLSSWVSLLWEKKEQSKKSEKEQSKENKHLKSGSIIAKKSKRIWGFTTWTFTRGFSLGLYALKHAGFAGFNIDTRALNFSLVQGPSKGNINLAFALLQYTVLMEYTVLVCVVSCMCVILLGI